jgi:hypothetical protein
MPYIWKGKKYKSRSAYMKAQWADPEQRRLREERSNVGPMLAVTRSPEVEAKRGESRRELWKTKAYREKMHVRDDNRWASKESHDEASNSMVAVWKRPSHRALVTASQHDYWSHLSKKEKKERTARLTEGLSERVKAQWADPAFYKKMLKVRHEQANRPEAKEYQSRGGRAVAKQSSKKMKALWKDPEFRKRNIAASKKALTGKPSWSKGLTKETDERIRHISEGLLGVTPTYGRKPFEYRNVKMRSSWEVEFAKQCDWLGLEWKYEPQYFYVGIGAWPGVTYRPDFYLPELRRYVEVKGYFGSWQKAKYAAFRKKFHRVRWQMLDSLKAVQSFMG